jgi:hypothetical protein
VSRRSRRRARDAASRLVPHVTQDVRGPAAWSRAPALAPRGETRWLHEGGGLGIGGHVLALALADGTLQAGKFQVGRAGDFHTQHLLYSAPDLRRACTGMAVRSGGPSQIARDAAGAVPPSIR